MNCAWICCIKRGDYFFYVVYLKNSNKRNQGDKECFSLKKKQTKEEFLLKL